ncbi:MAG TPA: cytochrome c nitrite reductase small subunit [Vicinamibacteria bacterium]|nr:cytochrome c nitrite reductase small subunit [Vicinamibacteria bacterium]
MGGRARGALAPVVAGLAGVAAGVGAFTFFYARGASYLTNDPKACANCHVMNEQYDGWVKSSHRSVAVCNDCHTPPDFVGKYATKASNGFWHSFYFTTGAFPEPIRITPRNRAVTERACRNCHSAVVEAMVADRAGHGGRDAVSCLRCHGSVGHLELGAGGSLPVG